MGSKAIVHEINQNQKGYQTPIILNFQNGKLNSENIEKVEFACAYDSETQKDAAIMSANGNIYHGLIESNKDFDTYIAIRNKRTKTVRIFQAEQAVLSHDIYSREVAITQELSKELAIKKLLKNFGGRKAVRYLQRNERMKVNVDSVKDQLEKTVVDFDSANGNDEINKVADTTGIENVVPPFNKSATTIDEVYTLNEIISQNLLDRLNEEANAVLANTQALPIPSEYILKQIMDIKNSTSKNSPQSKTKIKVYLYMDGLSALIKTKNRYLRKTTLSSITEKIENHIRLNFSPKDSTDPIKTSFSTDKAMCYFITLAILMSPNYEIDVNILSQELSKPRKKILLYASYVHVNLKRGTEILTLHLPKPIKTFSGKRARSNKF